MAFYCTTRDLSTGTVCPGVGSSASQASRMARSGLQAVVGEGVTETVWHQSLAKAIAAAGGGSASLGPKVNVLSTTEAAGRLGVTKEALEKDLGSGLTEVVAQVGKRRLTYVLEDEITAKLAATV